MHEIDCGLCKRVLDAEPDINFRSSLIDIAHQLDLLASFRVVTLIDTQGINPPVLSQFFLVAGRAMKQEIMQIFAYICDVSVALDLACGACRDCSQFMNVSVRDTPCI